ncbi:hypothetical protein FJ444_04830 [Aestuariibacter sp. GS-14]|uniref:hypothetical protein n=1 Tax=Aestuariibacter sp. GS-14 TaxID=2590670 RepID=UPI0011281E96|nr:hypothetical protein [Aestuariibacter sp. GS-14]TPV60949.1 hypothetical protein FJ444_04830 [Aestuariibacter sp. GS-14]
MKIILAVLLGVVTFNASANEQLNGFAKCSMVARILELENDADLFESAYKKLKKLEELDQEFINMVYYTEGLMVGFASASGKDKNTVARNFFYVNCDGSNKQYAEDLTKEN